MSNFKTITQTYLNKFSNTTKLISASIHQACKQIIIIPSYAEPELEKTLNSLINCSSGKYITEVIVVLNCSQDDEQTKAFHQQQQKELEQKYKSHNQLIFYFIRVDNLTPKEAGVGLARKIGMDEAIRRLTEIDWDGLLICLDADCCVSENYIQEFESYAIEAENYNTICINFEHVFESETDPNLKKGIVFYELFLRYYKECMGYCGFPYSFHTIGSSMAIKASVYCKAGGMNKRKAGEDFYFLNKTFHYGKVVELNRAFVYPSARISTRVPFGTGRAQQNFVDKLEQPYTTYAFQIFETLKSFLLMDFYSLEVSFSSLPIPLQHFFDENEFKNKLHEIKKNTSSKFQFQKRFFDWFNAFMLLKFVHFARDNYYPNQPILQEVTEMVFKLNIDGPNSATEEALLIFLRNFQMQNKFFKG